MSNSRDLSQVYDDVPLTGAGASLVDYVATGSIASAGLAVALNSDGTVSVVGSGGGGELLGTATVFESAATYYISTAFDSLNGKVVIAYRDDGNLSYGTVVVGTVSGTSISFGTPVVFESATSNHISTAFDSLNGKVVIAYRDDGNLSYGTAVVGTVSGTSISFGTPVVFESANSNYISTTFDSLNGKVVIAYRDDVNTKFGTAIVGTVSGTSISFGTPVVFESASSNYTSTTFDSLNNKVVITYRDDGNLSYGTAVVGTVSGTSISFGTPVVFASASVVYTSTTFDSLNNKVVIAYRDDGNLSYGTAVVGTVSGTSISFGTPVVFESASSNYTSATFDSLNNKVVIAYQDFGSSSFGTAIVGTVSGTSISFGTPVVFESATSNHISTAFDSLNNKVVIAYQDFGNTSFGTAIVYQTDTSNNSLTIGIAQAPATNAQTISVGVVGHVDTNQVGLTPGNDYFVNGVGALTDNSVSAVYIGKAYSATKLYIDRV